jgi:hypothetical protein
MFWWNTFTPQFETAIAIVSGPVTLLVALWGMTSARTREVCRIWLCCCGCVIWCWSDYAAVQMLIPTIIADLLSSEMVTH